MLGEREQGWGGGGGDNLMFVIKKTEKTDVLKEQVW